MAISFLEMNDIPRNYLYYKRFIDPEDEETKEGILNAKKKLEKKTKTTIDITDPVNEVILKKTYQKLKAKKLEISNRKK